MHVYKNNNMIKIISLVDPPRNITVQSSLECPPPPPPKTWKNFNMLFFRQFDPTAKILRPVVAGWVCKLTGLRSI